MATPSKIALSKSALSNDASPEKVALSNQTTPLTAALWNRAPLLKAAPTKKIVPLKAALSKQAMPGKIKPVKLANWPLISTNLIGGRSAGSLLVFSATTDFILSTIEEAPREDHVGIVTHARVFAF